MEDNGLMCPDGRPTLVVLMVTTDEGKQMRVPYMADRTLQQVYEDVGKIAPEKIQIIPQESLSSVRKSRYPCTNEWHNGITHSGPRPNGCPICGGIWIETSVALSQAIAVIPNRLKEAGFNLLSEDEDLDDDNDTKPSRRPIPGVIQPEDIIECVNIPKDVEDDPDGEIKFGKQYRVVAINGTLHNVNHYEVIDDSSDFKIRINMLPHYCKLIKKFTPQLTTKKIRELSINCESCDAVNLLMSESNIFKGRCRKCGVGIETTSEREIEKMKKITQKGEKNGQ